MKKEDEKLEDWMDLHENLSDATDKQEDARLQYECKQALARLHSPEVDVEARWEKFQQRLNREEAEKKELRQRQLRCRKLICASVAAAAVLVGFIFCSLGFFEWKQIPAENRLLLLEEAEVTPITWKDTEGKIHILEEQHSSGTSVNQKKVAQLVVPLESESEEKEVEEKDVMCHKNSRYNLVSIPRGKTYQLNLPDGTEVWMNAGSMLSFPSRFMTDTRTVVLEGEAYFKVSPDHNKPFVVIAGHVSTHVLGTEFNVKAYQGSDTHVTLVKGSVKVNFPEAKKEVMLLPGEDVTCAEDGNCEVKKVDTEYYVQWMNGYFYYDNVCLKEILRDLGIWYNLTIEVEEEPSLLNTRLHFVAERSDDIQSVVENLNMYNYLSVTKRGNTLVVSSK